MKHIFHVHTYRCGHASDDSDDDYINAAIDLGAEKITFTDHAPFPESRFKNRMSIEQLGEYLASLSKLKEKYAEKIEVEIGLEIEFLPSMMTYYVRLRKEPSLQIMMIGQHFYEYGNGSYSFDDDREYNRDNEFIGCGVAIIDGMRSGLFDVVAHPDRIFRRCGKWTPQAEDVALNIISTANEMNMPLENNLTSYMNRSKHHWRQEFWTLVDGYNKTAKNVVRVITGLDAHSVADMYKLAR